MEYFIQEIFVSLFYYVQNSLEIWMERSLATTQHSISGFTSFMDV